MPDPKRYFLARDNSCHWYLVENAHRGEWDQWLELDEDDERGWNTPDFATRIDHPSRVTFVDPKEGQ